MTGPTLRATGIGRDYRSAGQTTRALDGLDLSAAPGELVVVRGQSGSGKSTLLNILSGLDRPSRGEVHLGDERIDTASEARLAEIRRDRIGVVFQSFGLLSVLTAAENVELPLRIRRTSANRREARVAEVLALVGLQDHAGQRPEELSGGQQQRVGIARAIATRPAVLIADEPTAQLDSVTGARILEILVDLVESHGVAAVVATHDDALAERATRVITLRSHRV
jgi:putative ABC transport system ATP-binding protein